jgi:hypothetical protein
MATPRQRPARLSGLKAGVRSKRNCAVDDEKKIQVEMKRRRLRWDLRKPGRSLTVL